LVNLGVHTKYNNKIKQMPIDLALTDPIRRILFRDNTAQMMLPRVADRDLRKTQGDMKIGGLGKVRRIE
jgi:hypothetical protein